jgi:hypothetical protein
MNNKVNKTISNIFSVDSSNDKSDNSITSLSEISVQNLIRTISQNTLSSTHRMFDYCNQSELLGENTGRNLVEQDEKLKNINNDLDSINGNLGEVEKNLKKLNSKGCMPFLNFLLETLDDCCCFCTSAKNSDSSESLSIKERKRFRILRFFSNLCIKKNSNKSDFDLSNKSKTSTLASYEFTSDDGSFLSNRFDSKLKIKNLYDQTLKHSSSTSVSLRHTSFDKSIMNLNGQLNENLKFLDKKLTNLQSMANDIGVELNKQNSKIEITNSKALETRNKVNNANEMGNRILKKDQKTLSVLDKPDKNGIKVLTD